jgi:nucleotide-binding universal stress UspA family protein
MRILIGYDGSECANVAIDDLSLAGLGDDVAARVMTVADVYPRLPESYFEKPDPAALQQMPPTLRRAHELAIAAMTEAKQTVSQGVQRVTSTFPKWKVEPLACGGTPATSLIGEARTWGADLIVVGAEGRGAIARALLGSVSQAVVTHAPCSVRVARSRTGRDASANLPPRIVLGLDGSPNAAAALSAVSMRKWPAKTEVRVVVAMDIRLATVLPTMTHEFAWPVPIDQESQDWPAQAAQAAAHELERAGLAATPVVKEGDPKRVLVDEATAWPADCIFVGARGLSRLEGILLGSVSSTVAARAPCSVEVVRFE